MGGGPWTAPPGAPSDLNPPSDLPSWAMVMGGVIRGAAPILLRCAAVRHPQAWSARRFGVPVWARPSTATPAGAGGWGCWGAWCAGPAASPPPPASRSRLREGGRPLGSGGAEGRSCGPQARGGERGGGQGGAAPSPPAPLPRRALACHPLSPARPPRGILVPWGLPGGRGRRARPGRPPMGQCGRGGGRGGEPPRPGSRPRLPQAGLCRGAPFAPSWAPPVRRRSAAGRAGACGRFTGGACRGRGAPLTPGVAASLGGVRGRRLFGLPRSALGPEGRGGGGGGALWSPGAAP